VGGEGLVVYDTVTADSTDLAVPGLSAVGAFAPDGSMLVGFGSDGLVVVDLADGDVVAATEAPPRSVARAAWRPDGRAIDVVTGTQLTTIAVPSGTVSRQKTELPESASLAWSPNGDQLVSMQEVAGANRLFLSELGDDGVLGTPTRVDTTGLAIERLLGYSGDRTVGVIALQLSSGSLEQIIDVPLDDRSATPLTVLPPPGQNWIGTPTLAVATDTLFQGSTDFPERTWPWSYQARLVGCIVIGVFLLGLYVTRRPRRR
jgi:hypothetical protein